MTLSDISIRNSVFAWMIMIGLIVFGWICFINMGVSQMPDVDYPMVSVTATLEGAAPEVMETQVAEVLESAVMTIEGIKEVSSTSKRGQCRLSIEFDLDRNIDSAMQEVESKISAEQRSLPKDMDPVIIRKTNPEDQPIVMVTLTGNRSRRELMQYVDDHLIDRFTTIAGVGDVDSNGFTEPNLRIWIDKKKLKDAYLTVKDVINTVSGQHTEMPAGYITAGDKEINVRVMGEAAAQTAGMKVEEVNQLLKKFVGWYEPQYTSADLGKTFQECYDVKTVRPTKEYLEVYDAAKKRMADWGFEISNYNTGVMYGGYECNKTYRCA